MEEKKLEKAEIIFDDGNLKVRTADENIEISFRYTEQMVSAIKKIEGRRFDWDRKIWIIPKKSFEEVQKFIEKFGNMRKKIRKFLEDEEGKKVEEIKYPTTWNHYKREYVAVIKFTDDDEIQRTFLGRRTNFSSSGKNADIEYEEYELPESQKVGTILEIRKGSHKHLGIQYFRKDSDGWKYLGCREGTSLFFGGWKEDIFTIVAG